MKKMNIVDFAGMVLKMLVKQALIFVGLLCPIKSVRRRVVRKYVIKKGGAHGRAHALVKGHMIAGAVSAAFLGGFGAFTLGWAYLDIKWILTLWDTAVNASMMIFVPGGMA